MKKPINDYTVWTAIVTPMNEDSSVNLDDLEKLLREQVAAGNAITILGSTGEATNLDLDERKAILEFALGLRLDTSYMVGVGGTNIHDQKAWIEYLNTKDVDAYLLVVPIYAKPGVHGQYAWFKELMDASDRPVCLYNVPGRTAKALEVETLKMLTDHPRLWAMKEAGDNIEDFTKYATAAPKLHMLSGEEAMLPHLVDVGAKGIVSVAANVWPAATAAYARQCLSGEFNDHELWSKAIAALFAASNPIPAKAILHAEGRISTPTLRTPLHADDMVNLDSALGISREISTWYC